MSEIIDTSLITLGEFKKTCEQNNGDCENCKYSLFCYSNEWGDILPRDLWLPKDLEIKS